MPTTKCNKLSTLKVSVIASMAKKWPPTGTAQTPFGTALAHSTIGAPFADTVRSNGAVCQIVAANAAHH